MPIKLKRHYLNNWQQAGQHIHQADGDFYQMTGLYPTLDRQELKRAPSISSHLTHSGLDTVEGMFYDAVNNRYVLIGQDASDQLSCTYFDSSWAHVAATYVLDAAVSVMDGYMMRNFIYAHGYLWVLADTQIQNTDNYVTSALSQYNSDDGELIAYLGGRIYMARDTGRLYRSLTDGSDIESHYNPANDLTFIHMIGLKDDLLLVGSMMDGGLRIFRTGAYAKTSVRKLEDMAALPGEPGSYPSSGCPFCIHDNDLYLLSGDMANPDATVTRDLLAYTGYRIERVARIPGGTASPAAVGLISWRGELLYYEATTTNLEIKMLVGNAFIDLYTNSSYGGTGINPLVASLAGSLVLTAKSGSDEGIYHMGTTALQNGDVETSWLDGGMPGVKKRLIDVSMHVKGATATTVKTLSYKADDASSYTQLDTETDATERLYKRSIGLEFYRLRLKAAIADTSTTADVRLAGLYYTYAVGEE